MRFTTWKDYELIDVSRGKRLERWGEKILIRPDPQVIWNSDESDYRWKNKNAVYHRSNTGGGHWETTGREDESWIVKYKKLSFHVKMMNFKHTGVFPEQAVNWDLLEDLIKNSKRQLNILNLFAYTGGASLACAGAGAKVCHVDASKGMVSWARENSKLSGLSASPIRWIVEDCEKFVLREIKRGNKYDGIIMDPPSYGRGPKGEVWKIEENLFPFVKLCESLLSEDAKFFIINSYSAGLAPSVMSFILHEGVAKNRGGIINSDEIGIPVSSSKFIMPAGNTAIWTPNDLNLRFGQ